jgi:hypothetical protein
MWKSLKTEVFRDFLQGEAVPKLRFWNSGPGLGGCFKINRVLEQPWLLNGDMKRPRIIGGPRNGCPV